MKNNFAVLIIITGTLELHNVNITMCVCVRIQNFRCLQICENIKSRKKKIEFLSRFDLVDTNFIYT